MIYDILRDLGSFIGGLFALVAGGAAYIAGRIQARAARDAAALQVEAAREQTEALRTQNNDFRSDRAKELARERLTAARLLDSVLTLLLNDIDSTGGLLRHDRFADQGKRAPMEFRRLRKPPLDLIWSNLGLCNCEFVHKYLSLDAKIDQFAIDEIGTVSDMKLSLQKFESEIELLRGELGKEIGRADFVLRGAPAPPP